MFLFPCSYNEAFAFVAFVLMFIRYALECLISYSCSCIDVFVFAIMKLQIRLLPYSYGAWNVWFHAHTIMCLLSCSIMPMHWCVCFRTHAHAWMCLFSRSFSWLYLCVCFRGHAMMCLFSHLYSYCDAFAFMFMVHVHGLMCLLSYSCTNEWVCFRDHAHALMCLLWCSYNDVLAFVLMYTRPHSFRISRGDVFIRVYHVSILFLSRVDSGAVF